MESTIGSLDGIILCVLTIYVGTWIVDLVPFLKRNFIPAPVVGGLLCSVIIAIIYWLTDHKYVFDMEIRDRMLLVFFSTIGLNAKLKMLKQGGGALFRLVLVAGVFLFFQDLAGCLTMAAIGEHPAYGLFGGSISFAGGHGTAIAWGTVAEEAGLEGASVLGIGCATFGLIIGGMMGGPIAKRLMDRHGVEPPKAEESGKDADASDKGSASITSHDVLNTLLALAICVGLGEIINRTLFEQGVMLPGFLTALLSGVLLTNLVDYFKLPQSDAALELTQDVSLQVFLTFSMMAIELWTLADAIGLILIILVVQAFLMTVYAQRVVFRVMGGDYDAVVISSGFAGLGMGATPVAIANMNSVTRQFGPSAKAFLVIPLIGAFFIDLLNAWVIKLFIGMPFMQ